LGLSAPRGAVRARAGELTERAQLSAAFGRRSGSGAGAPLGRLVKVSPFSGGEGAFEYAARQAIFDQLLNRSLERACPELRIPAGFRQELLGCVGHLEAEIALGQAVHQVRQLDLDDVA